MPEKIDDLLPTAKDIQKQAALKEADKADQLARRQAAVEAEKAALIERLSKPSDLSEDEKIKLEGADPAARTNIVLRPLAIEAIRAQGKEPEWKAKLPKKEKGS